MPKSKREILQRLNTLKRAEMVDFAVAIANTFLTHIICPCGAQNEIKDYWYSGMFKDACHVCGEELDLAKQLNIKPKKEFERWVTKRTYEDDPVQEARIIKSPEYEITKLSETEQHERAWEDAARSQGFDFSKYSSDSIIGDEITYNPDSRFERRTKCNKKKKITRLEFELDGGGKDFIDFESDIPEDKDE